MPPEVFLPSSAVNTLRPKKNGSPKSTLFEALVFGAARLLNAVNDVLFLNIVLALAMLKLTV